MGCFATPHSHESEANVQGSSRLMNRWKRAQRWICLLLFGYKIRRNKEIHRGQPEQLVACRPALYADAPQFCSEMKQRLFFGLLRFLNNQFCIIGNHNSFWSLLKNNCSEWHFSGSFSRSIGDSSIDPARCMRAGRWPRRWSKWCINSSCSHRSAADTIPEGGVWACTAYHANLQRFSSHNKRRRRLFVKHPTTCRGIWLLHSQPNPSFWRNEEHQG